MHVFGKMKNIRPGNLNKGIYLSKALTCMKFFLYKEKMLFYPGDGYLFPHCCMDNNKSHRDHFTPQYTAFAQNVHISGRNIYFYNFCL